MSDTDTKHLDWIAAPLLVAGQPRSWGAGVWPWTCVVTFNGATYAASANDSRVHGNGHTKLGADFTTLEAAQEACAAFLREQRDARS
jgi:hypothetical protein